MVDIFRPKLFKWIVMVECGLRMFMRLLYWILGNFSIKANPKLYLALILILLINMIMGLRLWRMRLIHSCFSLIRKSLLRLKLNLKLKTRQSTIGSTILKIIIVIKTYIIRITRYPKQ